MSNPFYAGVCVYGKTEKRTTIIDGRARKSYGHRKPMGTWEVFIQEHYEGYISWVESSVIRRRSPATPTAGSATRSPDAAGGLFWPISSAVRAAVVGSSVLCTGRYPRPIYRCEQPNVQLGQRRCLTVAGKRIDEIIAVEMLHAVTPMAIEAAEEAEPPLSPQRDQYSRGNRPSASPWLSK